MQKLWFKTKRYGYGWYPSTVEGWFILVVFLILLYVPLLALLPAQSREVSPQVIGYMVYVLVLVIVLLSICVKKGEKARWRWGGK